MILFPHSVATEIGAHPLTDLSQLPSRDPSDISTEDTGRIALTLKLKSVLISKRMRYRRPGSPLHRIISGSIDSNAFLPIELSPWEISMVPLLSRRTPAAGRFTSRR